MLESGRVKYHVYLNEYNLNYSPYLSPKNNPMDTSCFKITECEILNVTVCGRVCDDNG